MREHKYKAKRLDGQWVEGYYFAKPILNLHFILEGENQWMIDPETLCEFTGLYDENKNMIYEHDIVQYSSSDYKQEVKYGIWDECGCHYTVYGWDIPDCEGIKVICNIFDNPELLEAKQMKLYNCPDCTHTEGTCENCSRYQMYHKTNFNEYNPWWPYQKTRTFTNIPYACQNCPNHPSNGGSGNCNCILGGYDFTCSVGGTSDV